MSKAIDFLNAHKSPTNSKWREEAQWRKDNEYWLQYAQIITLAVHKSMDESNMTQAQLAEKMGCIQQYVSNLLKGNTNMTIETIARLEIALNLDLIKTALSSIL